MSSVSCPNCNTPAPPGAMFCDHCGYDLRTIGPAAQSPVAPTYMVPSAKIAGRNCPKFHLRYSLNTNRRFHRLFLHLRQLQLRLQRRYRLLRNRHTHPLQHR
jgi:hypothetical protein